MRLVKKVINEENKKQKLNEGVGAVLGIAAVGALGFALYKLKKFIDKYAKFGPTISLAPFLSKIKQIEEEGSESKYKVIVKEKDNYKIIAIVEGDGRVFDSLTVDVQNDEIYRNHDVLKDKEPKLSDRVIPMEMPADADRENMDEISQIEDELINGVLMAITKHSKPKI